MIHSELSEKIIGAAMHQEELREAFQKVANMQAPGKIDPLP
jgi:hypothetical protein